MRLADLASTSDAVAATTARNEKVAILAELLAAASPEEVGIVVGLISGEPRQGRIGVGWATVGGLEIPPVAESTLTVEDLDAMLTAVADTHGVGSQESRDAILRDLLGRATRVEAEFVRRILIGDLRQGANAGIVTDAVARAADVPVAALRRAVMLVGDLPLTAEIAFRTGVGGLESVGLEVMRPIQPMLASTATSVGDAIELVGEASVEWKLDGIRIQVHRVGSTVRVWTRNLNEITGRLPEVVEAVRRLDAAELVLDGEVLGVDDEGGPLAFQESVSNRTAVTPYFFDILHHDGDDLLDTPLRHRVARLASVAGELVVPGVITADPAAGQAVLDEALAIGHEGVVIKAANSTYQAGRRGKVWLKVKPVHTLDLVVLAVEYGSGRRSGWLSNIHLGARDPGTGSFVMVGKTFKGMTDAMLAWQTERFRELAIADDGRTVRLRPEQVVEIALDGVQSSTRYPGGVALRFARVVRYRDDKPPDEIDTIDTIRAMR
jgi:ATP-dependent DNA ligase I